MKRCPECRRDYYDETLLYCLDDGTALLEGPVSVDEAGTVILPGEEKTRVLVGTSSQQISPRARLFSGLKRPSLVAAALGAVLITAFGLGSYFYYGRSSSQINSIAVMPFVNESGDAEVEYLSDGMTETLISSLSQLPKLKVKARSSVFGYKGKETDAKTVGKELGVQAVLNGRITQRSGQVTLRLEPVDSRSEDVIWSDKYARRQADLVTLQSDIARDVSSKLKTKLSGAETAKVERTYTDNNEAYQLYLKERYFSRQFTL